MADLAFVHGESSSIESMERYTGQVELQSTNADLRSDLSNEGAPIAVGIPVNTVHGSELMISPIHRYTDGVRE